MSFESRFFKKKTVRRDTLLPFGFVVEEGRYIYRQDFMDGNFQAQITIDKDSRVDGRIIDLDTGEDYIAFRAKSSRGSFVGQVRQDYARILTDIAEACFEENLFIHDQTKRLAHFIEETWGDEYDHPFATFSDYVSYRVAGKWYALVFPLKMGKLKNSPKEKENQEVEVVNIKVRPDQIASLIGRTGIYPSYHMNKKNWVSLVLDDSLSDEQLWDMVSQSRDLATPVNFRDKGKPQFWVIPANPRVYDVDQEFAQNQPVYWPQKENIQIGDYVFIYITAPSQVLRYACRVVKTGLEDRCHNGRDNASPTMALELFSVFEDSDFPLSVLKEHGLTNIRRTRRLTKSLIKMVEKRLRNEKVKREG